MKVSILCSTMVLAAVSAHATIIYSVSGVGVSALQSSANTAGGTGRALVTSWSETQAYSGVSISAVLSPESSGNIDDAAAYLMRAVGPGATLADEVASTVFSVSSTVVGGFGNNFPSNGVVPLFSGLSLSPGNYYLVLFCPCASLNRLEWWTADQLSGTWTTDTGVSQLDFDLLGNIPAFPPDGTITNLNSRTDRFDINVSGTAVVSGAPEPNTSMLLGAGLVLLAFSRRMMQFIN